MKARDVLYEAESAWWEDPVNTDEWLADPGGASALARGMADALLAQTPEGEGVYIAPDGTLMRVEFHHTISAAYPRVYDGDPAELGTCYRLVPIEEEP